jgi:hypothetical protein
MADARTPPGLSVGDNLDGQTEIRRVPTGPVPAFFAFLVHESPDCISDLAANLC